jgi:hypothetical protein
MTEVPITVYFVTNASTPSGQASGLKSPLMIEAYNSLRKRDYDCNWLEQSKIVKQPFEPQTTMFVLECFSGVAYDHLVDMDIRIISPLVIKFCNPNLKKSDLPASKPSAINAKTLLPFDTIPKRFMPIYSQCMRGLNITCTNLSNEKKRYVEEKVTQMCGNFDSSLNAKTHFLVSNSVYSRKYQAAVQLKIRVMSIEWIEKCWDLYQYHFLRAQEPEIVNRHLLPIFFGLTFSVSQVNVEIYDLIFVVLIFSFIF